MRYTEKQREALEFLFDKKDEAYGLMQFEDGEIYQLAENEFDNYCAIEEIIDTQQKEIEEKDKQIEELKEITEDYDSFPNDKEKTIVMASQSYFENGTFVEKFIPKEIIKELLNKEKEIKKLKMYAYETAPEVDENNIRLKKLIYEEIMFCNCKINTYKELLGE